MSQSRLEFSRNDRIRKAIMKEVGEILQREIQDPQLQDVLISVTDVDVSGDLQHAKVFVSIFKPTVEEQQATLKVLEEHTSKVRYLVGQRIRMRLTPSIKFVLDTSLERGMKVTELLNKIRDEQV